MKRVAVVEVKLSESAQEFMRAALDLLEAVRDSDQVLVTDRIVAAADDLETVIEGSGGDL